MTDYNAAQANNSARAALNECQCDAAILSGLLDAIDLLDNEGNRSAMTSVVSTAKVLANKLADDLDRSCIGKHNAPATASDIGNQWTVGGNNGAPATASDIGLRRDNITTPLYQAEKVEAMLRVISMAIDGEQICATSFADNCGGSLIDMMIEIMGDLIEKIEVMERMEQVLRKQVAA